MFWGWYGNSRNNEDGNTNLVCLLCTFHAKGIDEESGENCYNH